MRDVLIITDVERAKIIIEPTRLKILEMLRNHPMTISELSKALGKDKSTIYRHIKVLERADLVEEIDRIGNESVYARTARVFLIKVESSGDIEEFRRSYLRMEASRIAEILEASGLKITDKKRFVEVLENVFDAIEVESLPIIEKISKNNVKIDEIELFHLLNFLTLLASPRHVKEAEELRRLIREE
ncbi:ArsR/SmtB family transcription factor [Pyrococcus yayanosii]|uniref:Transcription regulator, arsR family n=1 Tax=Pyrococcus yayanosii (strain CH1 / JCM 16557) TaxID=529709 RepID=F8AFL7_PYRYC|nr:winged helix-turn-helix domain-containing protein [Pyrococcus yayanosii]AEH24983.1 Transcription regulator, arsR family [Pyrococcus yayanosii CH1]